MPYRLIECALPSQASEAVTRQLEDTNVLGVWEIAQADESTLVRILVAAEHSEELLHSLERPVSLEPDARIFLTEVLATLPDPHTSQGEEEPAESGGEEDQPPPERVAALELSTKLKDAVELNRNFFAMIVLSVVVAAVGLTRDDVAVVIGAMVIAPLLAPHMALALGTTLGDLTLLRQAGIAAAVTVAVGAGLSFFAGLILDFDPTVEQFVARTEIGLSDVVLALAAGAAGALAFTSGLSQGIVGVMVAVALLPPLVAFGLLAGAAEWEMAGRSILLFASNIVSVNLAAIGTFLLQGLRPSSYWEGKRAQRIAAIASSVWVALLAGLLALIFWLSS